MGTREECIRRDTDHVHWLRHSRQYDGLTYRRLARRLLRGFGAMANTELKSWRKGKGGRAMPTETKKKVLSPT